MSSKTSKVYGLSPEMERLYEKLHFVANQGCGMATGDWPLINVYKTVDGAIVEALIPGIDLSELKLSIRGPILTIDRDIVPCAVKKKDRIFLRTIEFPFSIDTTNSNVHTCNGLLRVNVCRSKNEECLSAEPVEGSRREHACVVKTLTGTEETSPKLIPVHWRTVDFKSAKETDGMVIPKTDIFETVGAYLTVVELPGIPCHAVDITLDGVALTIEAKKPDSLLQDIYPVYSEFETVCYRRRLSLFNDVDAKGITALLKNGTLKMMLPKKQQRSGLECR